VSPKSKISDVLAPELSGFPERARVNGDDMVILDARVIAAWPACAWKAELQSIASRAIGAEMK
jgi:hypothetical protein